MRNKSYFQVAEVHPPQNTQGPVQPHWPAHLGPSVGPGIGRLGHPKQWVSRGGTWKVRVRTFGPGSGWQNGRCSGGRAAAAPPPPTPGPYNVGIQQVPPTGGLFHYDSLLSRGRRLGPGGEMPQIQGVFGGWASQGSRPRAHTTSTLCRVLRVPHTGCWVRGSSLEREFWGEGGQEGTKPSSPLCPGPQPGAGALGQETSALRVGRPGACRAHWEGKLAGPRVPAACLTKSGL